MALQDQKITSSDLANKGVEGLPDTPNLSTLVMQQKFDEIAKKVIVPKFNALIDYLIASLTPIVSDNPQDGEVLIYFADSSQYKNGVYRTTLADLKDVNVGGVQNKMFLCYDADRDLWYPEASSGVMETISACKDVSIVNPQTGDIFKFDGTAWANVPDERGLLIVFNIDSEDGATITALTPSGNTVTATSLGGGQYVIKSDEYGEWVLTGEKNGETVTATVSVDTAKIYDVTMNFFAATITVTYPADATVTCSKDSEEYTATGSPYTFTVHDSGAWVIEGTRSGITETQTVTITTNGQSESVTLTILPDGSTVTPTDSIPTLLHCADIWDKSYTSIGEVLDDSDSLFKILTTDNSIDYLVRSTTWTTAITADSDAMAMIGSYDYASDTLLNDSTWASAIANSSYALSVFNISTPTMTSDTTPKGKAIADTTYSSRPAYYAFDKNGSTSWSAGQTVNHVVAYTFEKAFKPLFTKVTLPAIDETFNIVSRNGTDAWTQLKSAQSQSGSTTAIYSISPSEDYETFGIYVTQASNGWATIVEADFYGRQNGGVQSWLRAGGIDKDYTTLAEVLADTTTLAALIASQDAVDYLVTAKAFIDGIVADATAMSYIGLNNYCANTLLADSDWKSAICHSTYKESILNGKNPIMTSNNAPSGECFADAQYTPAYNAFDGVDSNYWLTNGYGSTVVNEYVGYSFENQVNAVMVEMLFGDRSNFANSVTYKIQGSNDKTNWTDESEVVVSNLNARKIIVLSNNNCQHFRALITNAMSSNARGSCADFRIYYREDV